MSIPTNRKAIIELAKENNNTITKKQVVEKLGHTYHYNGDKHLGAILSTMVKNGILERVKKGIFNLVQSPINTKKQKPLDKDQVTMF
jgi:predicted transcriptional regulator of viral defense system